jgi:metal-dependent HD superfamily phosphatase/phosphodiesterase
MINFQDIKSNPEIHSYIAQGDRVMKELGYTEHSFPHASISADRASKILAQLQYSERDQELAKIAGYMHDIGNLVNRVDHAHSGGILAFQFLRQAGMEAEEVALIVSAIGNHDEATAVPVNPISAALILADKSDVRRTRVRNRNTTAFDIHDRVNYAVEHSNLSINEERTIITLDVTIDPNICPPMEYFEIFIGRMLLCRRAAEFLKLQFSLIINSMKMM